MREKNTYIYIYIVTCIARQQTDKNLATEYTYATIELRMLFLVARQREAPMKSLSGNYVTGCLWSVPCPVPSNDTDKHSFATIWEETVFYAVCTKVISPPLQI
jgi:hypothetical protein